MKRPVLSFLNFLAAYSLIASSYDNDFVIFSVERKELLFSVSSSTIHRYCFFLLLIVYNFFSASQLVTGNVI